MNKKSTMFLVMLGIWLWVIFYFDFRFLSLLVVNESIIASSSVIIFIACLNIFWLYGLYHIIVPLFSIYAHPEKGEIIRRLSNSPRVAILYTTMNDFKESCAVSCLNQDYNNYHLFICDDSTDDCFRKEIDRFAARYSDRVTVFRRDKKTGFKAGNINHALRKIHKGYRYFAISDADGVLPGNFISGLLPYFSLDRKIGFVQASQRQNPYQEGDFGKEMSPNVDIHWKYYVPAKEKYGFTMFYGHGALIKTSTWEKAGGLPEITTEDLSFSMRVRMLGYKGILADDIVCYEDFPHTYRQFRKRNEKWIKGTMESLGKDYLGFLTSRDIPWCEKLDVLISASSLMIAAPFSVFLLLISIAFPFFFNLFKFNGPLIITPVFVSRSWTTYLMSIRYNVYWTWDLLFIMILMIFGPSFPVILAFYKTPKKMFRYMAISTYSYLSVIVVSTINLFTFIITRKAPFPVTGDNYEKKKGVCLSANSGIVQVIEILAGVLLLCLTIKNMNMWLLSISLALLLNPFLLYGRVVKPILYMPFAITLFITVLIIYSLL